MNRVKRLAVLGAVVGAMALPATAFAYPNDPSTTIAGSSQNRAPEVAGTSQTRGSNTSSLPFTGADIAEMTLFGAGAIGAGAFMVRRSRRTA